MLVYTHQKNIAQVFILERYFFVSIYPAAIPGTYLAVFLVAVLQLCWWHRVKEYAVCWLIAKMPMLIGESWSRDSKKKVMKPWQIVTGWNFMPLTANCAWQTLPTQSNSSALSSRFLHQRQSLSRYGWHRWQALVWNKCRIRKRA